MVNAPAVGVCAWRIGSSWSSVWHLVYEATPNRTLCQRRVPMNTTVARERHGSAPTCSGCLKILDSETKKRLEVTHG